MSERTLKTWESKYKRITIKFGVKDDFTGKDGYAVEDSNLRNGKVTSTNVSFFDTPKEASEYFGERTAFLSEYSANKGIEYSVSNGTSSRGIGSSSTSGSGK